MVLAGEAPPSWLGSQQEKNEQETAVHVGSSLQGIVEYLFVCLLVWPRLTLKRISGKEIWYERREAENLGQRPGTGLEVGKWPRETSGLEDGEPLGRGVQGLVRKVLSRCWQS